MRTTLAFGLLLVAAPAFAQPQTAPPAEGGAVVVEETTAEDLEATSAEPPPPEPPLAPEVAVHPPPPQPEPERISDFRHRNQFSARAMFGKGYRLAFAYGEEEVCGRDDGVDDKTPCYSASPAFTDLDLFLGLTDGIELSLLVRLGLEEEFTGAEDSAGVLDKTRPLTLGLGIRAYSDPPARVKFYLGARVMYDLTKAGANDRNDLAVRAEPGIQIEIVRYVAFFVQADATIGFLRWLRFEIDAGAGLQLRIP